MRHFSSRLWRKPAVSRTHLHRKQRDAIAGLLLVHQHWTDPTRQRKNGDGKEKMAALLWLAADPDLAPLPRDQLFGNVQAQPQALASRLTRIGYLIEVLKNAFGHVWTDPASRVGNLHQQEARIFLEHAGPDLHCTAGGRKLNGVVNQNNKDLLNARWVSVC